MAYTVSAFAVHQRHPVPLGNSPFAIASGTITINPYHQTGAEVTNITKLFKPSGLLIVTAGPMDASFKYIVVWDPAVKCFNAYTASSTEAANDASDIGSIEWMAIGQVG